MNIPLKRVSREKVSVRRQSDEHKRMLTVNFSCDSAAVVPLLQDMRGWLDHHHIEPARFTTRRGQSGELVLRIRFRHMTDARLFKRAFSGQGCGKA